MGEKQLHGGHLALTWINAPCPHDQNGRPSQCTGVTLKERHFGERMWEVHIKRFISELQLRWKAGPANWSLTYWQVWDLPKKIWAALDTSAKERGKVQQYHLLSPRYPQDWKSHSCSVAMADQSNLNAVMRSWEERKYFLILPLSVPTTVCSLTEELPNFISLYSATIWL